MRIGLLWARWHRADIIVVTDSSRINRMYRAIDVERSVALQFIAQIRRPVERRWAGEMTESRLMPDDVVNIAGIEPDGRMFVFDPVEFERGLRVAVGGHVVPLVTSPLVQYGTEPICPIDVDRLEMLARLLREFDLSRASFDILDG